MEAKDSVWVLRHLEARLFSTQVRVLDVLLQDRRADSGLRW